MALSCGRDKVVILWSLDSGDKMKTVPVTDSVEGMGLASTDKLQVIQSLIRSYGISI
jgi:hypothetical protein